MMILKSLFRLGLSIKMILILLGIIRCCLCNCSSTFYVFIWRMFHSYIRTLTFETVSMRPVAWINWLLLRITNNRKTLALMWRLNMVKWWFLIKGFHASILSKSHLIECLLRKLRFLKRFRKCLHLLLLMC